MGRGRRQGHSHPQVTGLEKLVQVLGGGKKNLCRGKFKKYKT